MRRSNLGPPTAQQPKGTNRPVQYANSRLAARKGSDAKASDSPGRLQVSLRCAGYGSLRTENPPFGRSIPPHVAMQIKALVADDTDVMCLFVE